MPPARPDRSRFDELPDRRGDIGAPSGPAPATQAAAPEPTTPPAARPSNPVKKRQAKRRQTDEEKARRIAAKYGVYWYSVLLSCSGMADWPTGPRKCAIRWQALRNPVAGCLGLASQAKQIEEHAAKHQQANARGDLRPKQLVGIWLP